MPADKPTGLSRIKQKTWTPQPVHMMISKHSAHSTSLPIGFRTWLWRKTYLLLLISMLWHRQAIFESKGDKLPSSAECMIRTQGLRHLFASRLNACWQTDWAIEDQAKNLNSTARPYDQRYSGPRRSCRSEDSPVLASDHMLWAHKGYVCVFVFIFLGWTRVSITPMLTQCVSSKMLWNMLA